MNENRRRENEMERPETRKKVTHLLLMTIVTKLAIDGVLIGKIPQFPKQFDSSKIFLFLLLLQSIIYIVNQTFKHKTFFPVYNGLQSSVAESDQPKNQKAQK